MYKAEIKGFSLAAMLKTSSETTNIVVLLLDGLLEVSDLGLVEFLQRFLLLI